jgi:hypothetical protein
MLWWSRLRRRGQGLVPAHAVRATSVMYHLVVSPLTLLF